MAIEFVECGTLSISYDATGKATINYTKIRDNAGIPSAPNNLSFGGRTFKGNTMSIAPNPLIGSGGWFQWQISWQGIGT